MQLNIATLSVLILAATAIVLHSKTLDRPQPPVPVAARPAPAAPAAAPLQTARVTDETPEVLPEGKGRDETFYLCTACHGTAIITQQGLTHQRWEETFDWMIEKHRMPDPGAAERALIVDYLAAAFPTRQRGRVNPFANR